MRSLRFLDRALIVVLVFGFGVSGLWADSGAPEAARTSGPVVDLSGVLSPEEESGLAGYLAEQGHAPGILVVTVPWIGSPVPRLDRPQVGSFASYTLAGNEATVRENYSRNLTQGGSRSRNRIVLFVSPEHDVAGTRLKNPLGVQLELEAGLGKKLPPEAAARVVRERMVPEFTRGRIAAGIRATLEAVVAIVGPGSGSRTRGTGTTVVPADPATPADPGSAPGGRSWAEILVGLVLVVGGFVAVFSGRGPVAGEEGQEPGAPLHRDPVAVVAGITLVVALLAFLRAGGSGPASPPGGPAPSGAGSPTAAPASASVPERSPPIAGRGTTLAALAAGAKSAVSQCRSASGSLPGREPKLLLWLWQASAGLDDVHYLQDRVPAARRARDGDAGATVVFVLDQAKTEVGPGRIRFEWEVAVVAMPGARPIGRWRVPGVTRVPNQDLGDQDSERLLAWALEPVE